MKVKFWRSSFIASTILPLFMLPICDDMPTTPDDPQLFQLSNGFYQIIDQDSSYAFTYSFDYSVRDIECRVSGFVMKWGNHSWQANWYYSPILQPGKTYTESFTMYLQGVPPGSPVVNMRGYYTDTWETDDSLMDELVLQRKE